MPIVAGSRRWSGRENRDRLEMKVWLGVAIVPKHIFVVQVEPPLCVASYTALLASSESKSHATGKMLSPPAGSRSWRSDVMNDWLKPTRDELSRFSSHPFATFVCGRLYRLPSDLTDSVLSDRKVSTSSLRLRLGLEGREQFAPPYQEGLPGSL